MNDSPTPAGWYADPSSPNAPPRYWDGHTWHTREESAERQGAPFETEAPTHLPAPEQPKRSPGRWKVWTAVGVGIAVVAAIGTTVTLALVPTQIERAAEACEGTSSWERFIEEASLESEESEDEGLFGELEIAEYFEGSIAVEDNGRTLLVSTKPADDDPLGISALVLDCVYAELDTPSRVSEVISSTRALDGRQTATWDSYSASWGYHPDNGLDLIVSDK
ncbi:DUF2510 domain-containing protein [Microbacterium gubbeenense]|uniref:DUF2510 domain-containing protein n=1 Tax=Microbacterium gubbeenense TaxID=159896 RepID=UPI003F985879